MKRDNKAMYIAALILAAIVFSFLTIYAFGEHKEQALNTSARSAALYQPEIDAFIYSKNADERLPMASTTKIMTALVAIENSSPSDMVVIDDAAIGVEGSSAYLKSGDILTMDELLYALLLQSANDAAVAIACHISGDVEEFSALMNEKAHTLGLTNTNFTNPHGLDNKEHYTTARELAIIASAALENEKFKEIASTYKKSFVSEDRSRTYINHNKLLYLYDGCVGVKTGFTKRSGRCLVGAAEKDGLCFISVTLDAPSDWNDHSVMLNYGFEHLERICLAEEYDHVYKLPVIGGESEFISVANTNGVEAILQRSKHDVFEHIKLARYTVAPINRGDILGEIIYTVDGKETARVDILATESVKKKEEGGFLSKIISMFD